MSKSYSKIRHIQESNMILETRRFNQLLESKMGDVKPLINEASQAEMMSAIAAAKKKVASGDREPDMEAKIKECITNKQLTSLMFLTTGAGAYALGVIAALCVSGIGTFAGLTLALAGVIVLFITGLPEDQGGIGSDPAKDVEALLSCIGL